LTVSPPGFINASGDGNHMSAVLFRHFVTFSSLTALKREFMYLVVLTFSYYPAFTTNNFILRRRFAALASRAMKFRAPVIAGIGEGGGI
jgi:hypothetical protein